MATFPTFTRHTGLAHTPEVGSLNSEVAHNPTVRSLSDGGYVKTRARFTRISRRWNVRFAWMSQTNKNTLKTFEDARLVGSESFTWTNPEDSTAYTVRFLEPVRYIPIANTNYLWWNVEFTLEQV